MTTMRQWRLMIDDEVGETYREPEFRARPVRVGGMTRRQRQNWAILLGGAAFELGLSLTGLVLAGLGLHVFVLGAFALVLVLVGVGWNR